MTFDTRSILSVRRVAPLLLTALLHAEQLPIRVYTTEDGLPSKHVARIVRDSRGFLWFCTPEGLARFDGYRFTTYGAAQGLTDRVVTSIVETAAGNYWIATGNGLFRLRPGATGKPIQQPALFSGNGEREPGFNLLALDTSGWLWASSTSGVLSRLEADAEIPHPVPVELGIPGLAIFGLLADHRGDLWIGSQKGLLRRSSNGKVEEFRHNGPLPGVGPVIEDRAGRIWVGTDNGLFRITPAATPQAALVELLYRDPSQSRTWVEALWEDSKGGVLAAMQPRIGEFAIDAKPGTAPRWRYTYANGLVDTSHTSITEDMAGNLWVGCEGRGAIRISRTGFVSYDRPDGLGGTRVASIFEDRAGELLALTGEPTRLNRWDGSRFKALEINFPPGVPVGWGWNHIMLQDHRGEWWVTTQRGLLRFPPIRADQLAHARPKAFYTPREGLPGTDVFRVYEDSRGDIWIASMGGRHPLSRWDRTTDRLINYSGAEGLALNGTVTAFAEDRQGGLWMGSVGWVARYYDGQFRVVSLGSNLADLYVRDLHVDKDGRLWIACRRGLLRIDDPTAQEIKIRTFTVADGLSSEASFCITEDRFGHVYIGTGQGVDRLNLATFPAPGAIRHFSNADGLAPGQMSVAYCDRRGTLWFGTLSGLSALEPQPDVARALPSVFVTGLRVRNVAQPISELGVARVGPLWLEPAQNQVSLDFSALSFWPGDEVRFQYKFDGIDADWSAPTAERSVNYTNLAAGRYRLLVRATGAAGSVNPQPAEVQFTVLRPVWQRWWFLLACALAIAAVAYWVHRYVLMQALALERMRTHIARDLHDEIGSSLSQIAILSEVAQHSGAGAQPAHATMPEIASIARELVDAMGDIVWAINPKHDRVGNLLHRMRRFGEETLGACNIELRFRAPEAGAEVRTQPEVRRHIFLVFKEAVANVAKHSGAHAAEIDVDLDGRWLRFRVTDDGCGFDTAAENDGDGLTNMTKRVEALGGGFDLHSAPGQGTRLAVSIPLEPQRNRRVRQ